MYLHKLNYKDKRTRRGYSRRRLSRRACSSASASVAPAPAPPDPPAPPATATAGVRAATDHHHHSPLPTGLPRRSARHSPGTDSEPVACGSPDSWSLSCSPSSSKICATTASLQQTCP